MTQTKKIKPEKYKDKSEIKNHKKSRFNSIAFKTFASFVH